MPRFKATFRHQGRQHERIIRGNDCYAVMNSIGRTHPKASELTIAPMPKDEKLKTYEVSLAKCGDPSIRRMRAASQFEVRARIAELDPPRQILRLVEIPKH